MSAVFFFLLHVFALALPTAAGDSTGGRPALPRGPFFLPFLIYFFILVVLVNNDIREYNAVVSNASVQLRWPHVQPAIRLSVPLEQMCREEFAAAASVRYSAFPCLGVDPQCAKATSKVPMAENITSVRQVLVFEIHLAKFIQVSWWFTWCWQKRSWGHVSMRRVRSWSCSGHGGAVRLEASLLQAHMALLMLKPQQPSSKERMKLNTLQKDSCEKFDQCFWERASCEWEAFVRHWRFFFYTTHGLSILSTCYCECCARVACDHY